MEENGFIKQTAKDYDMPYSIVKELYDKYGSDFYEKLEEYIIERSQK